MAFYHASQKNRIKGCKHGLLFCVNVNVVKWVINIFGLKWKIWNVYTLPPKVWKCPRKWGFGQYWHESFLICDNFALIRDNTNYENIFYYINSLYIKKSKIFDSSKYPPLAAITALHNLGNRAVSLFKHWFDILLQASWRIAQRWFTLVGHINNN